MYAPPHSRPSCAKSVTAALEREEVLTLKLDLVLNNECLSLVVNLGGELGRDGMMSGGVLQDETLVTVHARKDSWLLNGPLANVGPILVTLRVFLLGM